MLNQMSLSSTTLSCARKTKMTSKHGRRRRSSMHTMRFSRNMASTQIMTGRACASCSNWSDPASIRKPLYTKSSSSCCPAQALPWTTEMTRSPWHPAMAQCCTNRKELEDTEEQWRRRYRQKDLRDGIHSHQCTMLRPRSRDTQNGDLYSAPLVRTCRLKIPPSAADLCQIGLHAAYHAEDPIQHQIILRHKTNPWEDIG